jgi:2-oxo-4-hydroxy-4-carboxy-5-ureidoimidazoline decarboxylase
MSPAELGRLNRDAFVAALEGIYEHSPGVAGRAYASRPFANLVALHDAMAEVVATAARDEKLALIRAHPELAGRAAVRGELTSDSTREQTGAGLTQCSPAELAELQALNARYNARFGFPFILAVKGYDRGGILAEFRRRVERQPDEEFAEALAQIGRIARFRLDALLSD